MTENLSFILRLIDLNTERVMFESEYTRDNERLTELADMFNCHKKFEVRPCFHMTEARLILRKHAAPLAVSRLYVGEVEIEKMGELYDRIVHRNGRNIRAHIQVGQASDNAMNLAREAGDKAVIGE